MMRVYTDSGQPTKLSRGSFGRTRRGPLRAPVMSRVLWIYQDAEPYEKEYRVENSERSRHRELD
jgi:hypothetical protein